MENQKNIVTTPNKKLAQTHIKFDMGGEVFDFKIMSNIKPDEIYPVLNNWINRTNQFTPQSLVDYINSKSVYGFKAQTI